MVGLVKGFVDEGNRCRLAVNMGDARRILKPFSWSGRRGDGQHRPAKVRWREKSPDQLALMTENLIRLADRFCPENYRELSKLGGVQRVNNLRWG